MQSMYHWTSSSRSNTKKRRTCTEKYGTSTDNHYDLHYPRGHRRIVHEEVFAEDLSSIGGKYRVCVRRRINTTPCMLFQTFHELSSYHASLCTLYRSSLVLSAELGFYLNQAEHCAHLDQSIIRIVHPECLENIHLSAKVDPSFFRLLVS
jgi:hypothetical protein